MRAAGAIVKEEFGTIQMKTTTEIVEALCGRALS